MKGRWKNSSGCYLSMCRAPAPKPDIFKSYGFELKPAHGTFGIRLFHLNGDVQTAQEFYQVMGKNDCLKE